MTTTIYTSTELSNERYHSEEFPQASGSVLAEIISTCPAEFIGRERKESAALTEGSAAHMCILEPAQFKQRYARGIDAADYPDALEGNKAFEGWLKDRGVKCSGKVKAELLALIDATGENPQILQRIIDSHAEECAQKNIEVVAPDVYDRIIKMRSALKKFGYTFSPALQYEHSIVSEDFKVRMDMIVPPGEMAPDGTISKNGEIWDYKSCADVSPLKFGASALKLKYWLKMALQADLFKEHFGHYPDRVVLLAQSKSAPFVPVAYSLDAQQLEAGRIEYWDAYHILQECKSSGVWSGYVGNSQVIPLPTPGWAAYEYGFEDTVEIIEG